MKVFKKISVTHHRRNMKRRRGGIIANRKVSVTHHQRRMKIGKKLKQSPSSSRTISDFGYGMV